MTTLLRTVFILAALLMTAPTLSGQEPTESDTATLPSWTSEFSLGFRSISSTALSPDGKLVAFVVREAITEGEKSEYLSHIWVTATDGSWSRQYTQGTSSATSPQFSPDGRWLAFTTKRGKGEDATSQVWRLALAGGEATELTRSESGAGQFAFSPDGQSIAYLARDPETEDEEKAKKEKRDPVLVDQNHKYQHLYLHTLGQTALDTEKPEDDPRLTEGSFHITSFDWSPDGKTIVIGHQRDPRINTGMIDGDLSLVSVESGTVTPLVATAGVEGSPMFSPDGKWIAYVGTGSKAEPVGLGDVYAIAANGENAPFRLEKTPDQSANLVAWRADSKSLLISESIGTTRQLLDLPVEGAVRVFSEQGGEPMAGVIGSPSLARGGTHIAYVYQTRDQPPEVYASPTAGFAPMKLTSINSTIELPPMGETDLVTWTSKDGKTIEGLITYPVGFDRVQRAKAPLILNVHGGPAGVFSQSFTGSASIYLLQYFAEQGYAVLRPNPRGSTGYGRDFRFDNVRDWGFGDYEDLMAGVDWAIEQGIADPERLYVMGWSYGGYMTSFVITRTSRFQAASMGAGLPNLVSMVHTTDIPDYLTAHQGAELWEDIEEYERHSAMYHLDKVTTPTQILHGMNDLRVPFDQGRELYLGLQRLGIPTEMVAYPRTPHGPREPKLLIDVSPRILKWFEANTATSSSAATSAKP